jgi:hypothetical protein
MIHSTWQTKKGNGLTSRCHAVGGKEWETIPFWDSCEFLR